MREQLVLKHVVGGSTFIHTGKRNLDYKVISEGDSWKITITLSPEMDVKGILKWKHELSILTFQEFEDQPTMRVWFYFKIGPVLYDEQSKVLSIIAESRIDYVPSIFSV